MGSSNVAEEMLVEAAVRVLQTGDLFENARVANKWLNGDIKIAYDAATDIPVPDRPSRLTNVKLVRCRSWERWGVCKVDSLLCTLKAGPLIYLGYWQFGINLLGN